MNELLQAAKEIKPSEPLEHSQPLACSSSDSTPEGTLHLA